jgi:putative transposase
MHALELSYVTYFNKRHKKVGHLWQDRFKSKVVIKDRYLLDCMNYIELNPVRARITESPLDYPWSSYKERALNEKNGFSILDPLIFY